MTLLYPPILYTDIPLLSCILKETRAGSCGLQLSSALLLAHPNELRFIEPSKDRLYIVQHRLLQALPSASSLSLEQLNAS